MLKLISSARDKIAQELNLINEDSFAFCWIVDYPMFEIDENTKKINLATILFQCHKEIYQR